jgi:guanylate kinase
MSEASENCAYSISCTTREIRAGEMDGKDYHFLTEEMFLNGVEKGEFLEYARVHGNLYGTRKRSVLDLLEEGTDVLMDLDVQGAEKVRRLEDEAIRGSLVDIFLLPPTLEELKSRLSARATENDQQLDLRLKNALAEMREWRKYSHTIVTGTRDADFEKFDAILKGERLRSSRLKATNKNVAEWFLY